ncbi:hypothetical protein ABH942_001637 [Flavobacterium sp. 28YEA47A]
MEYAALLFHEYRHAWQYNSGKYDKWSNLYKMTPYSNGYEDLMERDAYWFQIQMGAGSFFEAYSRYEDFRKKTGYIKLPY